MTYNVFGGTLNLAQSIYCIFWQKRNFVNEHESAKIHV